MNHDPLEFEMKYDEDGWRWYGNLPSLTTIIGNTVNNPKLNSYYKKNSERKIEKVLTETADIGTRSHACFENILKNKPFQADVDISHIVTAFQQWKDENNVKPLFIEKSLCSFKYGFACTIDFLGYVNGELTLIDWKTSRNYKITNGWQLGGQRIAAMEALSLPNAPLGLQGLQISRDDGKVSSFKYQHIQEVEDVFLNTLDMFKMLFFNKLKKMDYPWLFRRAMQRVENVVPLREAS